MNGWTLETVRSLDAEDYEQIIDWLQDEADRVRGEGSVDMDALLADRRGTRREDD